MRKPSCVLFVGLAVIATSFSLSQRAESASSGTEPTFEWIKRYGAGGSDAGRGLAADSLGNVYMSGHTDTSSSPSLKNIFITSFDSLGNLEWVDPAVTNTGDTNNNISTDGNGNVYIASSTAPFGSEDLLLRKYATGGNVLWTRQAGTSARDFGMSVTADPLGNVFATGYTLGDFVGTDHAGWDGYLIKYDAAGTHQWTRQFGTDFDDYGLSLCADNLGNVYVVGITDGSLGGPNPFPIREDVFVSKYSAIGNLLWTRQFGTTGSDFPVNAVFDSSGAIYISGATNGSLGSANLGNYDAFLTKIDLAGNLSWTRQLGTSSEDIGSGVAVDESGLIYLAGSTQGALSGPNFGLADAFLASYDAAGSLVKVQQFGTTANDAIWGVAADGLGNLYVSGTSNGNLGGVLEGGNADAFLAKIRLVPEPPPRTLFVFVALVLAQCRHRTMRVGKGNG